MVASTSPSALQIARFQKSLQGPSSSLLAHIAFPHETVLTPPPSISSRGGVGGDNNYNNNNGKGNNGRRRDHDFVSSFKSFAETSQTSSSSSSSSSASNHRLYTPSAREPELIPDVMMYPPGVSTSSSSSTLPSYMINNGGVLPPNEMGLQKASDIALLKIARNDGNAYGEDDVAYFRHFYSSIAYAAAEAASNRDSIESANSASKARKWAATMNRLRSSEVGHVSSRDKPHHPNHQHQQPQTTSSTRTTSSACTSATSVQKRLASREVLFTPATQGALAELRAFRSGLQALESRRRRFNAVLGREPSGTLQEREIEDPRISPFVF